MKLYHTPTSPFVRKVMIAAHELGLADRIEAVFLRPSALAPSDELSRANPLSKIPTLLLDDGTALFDSRVIVDYLDQLAGCRLVPAAGPERWRQLKVQALADGVLDAGILVFYERTMRPSELQWTPWLDGQMAKVRQGLDALEVESAGFGEAVDLAQIAAAACLGWLIFRQVVAEPFAGRPTLAGWYSRFEARPSMRATTPHT